MPDCRPLTFDLAKRIMIEIALSAVTILLVTVGPIEVASMFVALTAGTSTHGKQRLALSASLIGAAVLLAFALGGNRLLALLQVGVPAFPPAGGTPPRRLSAAPLLPPPPPFSSI